MMIVTGITVEQFISAVALAGRRYGDNLLPEIGTKYSATRFNARVTLAATGYKLYGRGTELAPGQRRSWQGRRCNAACWHAYRDVLVQVFNLNPNARVRTAYAKYIGAAGFLREYPGTAYLNVGSRMQPANPIDLCDCGSSPIDLGDDRPAEVNLLSDEEREMIDWWAQQSERALARR